MIRPSGVKRASKTRVRPGRGVRTIAPRAGAPPDLPNSQARCHVAKGQVKQSKNNKPKLSVKEKFAKKQAKLLAKGK